MKTKVEDKKAKKRSLSETSVSIKSNQKQENINEFKKGSKKAKLAGVKQNGNPTSGEKAPILKVVDKQKKEQNKAIKQQSNIVKLSETKRDTKEKTELTVVKSMKETGDRINKRNKRRPARPYNQRDLTVEQITEKIAEIQRREVLSKRAKKLLGVLKRKLRESGNNSEKLDIVGKKSNKKAEHRENVLMQSKQKANDESKTKAEKKHIQSKGKPQEEDDDDSDIEEDDEDSDVEEESLDEESLDEEDEIMKKREIQKTVLKRLEEFKSDEDEDEELESEENEEEVENEEDEEEVENEEDEDEEVEENEEDDEDVEDEEDQEDEEDEVQTDFITEDEIKRHFLTKIDSITSIRIPTKPDKSPRGFAYVEVTNNIDFEKGLSLNHTFLNKRRINVQYSLPAGGKKANDATKKFMVAKNMKLQALQKAGKLAGGNQKKKPFKKENRFHIGRAAAPQVVRKIKKKNQKNLLGKGDEERFRCLKNKLQRVQAKLCESRNTCAALRQEINKAQKLLCSEVGENVSISALSSAPGGWRGRAEQIRNLQQKLAELQTRLSENERSQKESCDRQNLAYLRNVEKERRQQIENTAKELRQAEVALEASKRKLDASKARIKILEQELSIAKGKIAMLNEKRSHDDRLIDALNERLKISEARYQDHEMDVQNREHKIERENANIKNELRATQLHVDRLRRRLEEREIEIDKLRNGILSDESLKCRISLHPDFRLTEERQISPAVSPRNLGEPNEYVILALAAEAERVRLLELVTLLNQRLDKERNEADALAELLRKEKSKWAKLELKLRDSEKERVGLAKVDTRYRARSCAKSMSSLRTEEETTNPDEVRYKIELLEEECLALKTRLDTVQQDKASDLAMYKRMLDQARKTFKDACRNKLATGGSRSTITI
ncbi:coiled-coil domain-containing protein 13-like [Temnothorax curvispinosus]|uniref:Coiled-coil domain-containing protein 13-like n=1 Tax=Temnothorax curvispinosus TaxID=300111 RepID=A0A6J1Q0H1_9HYME|nr:coiled-coil domain-containing protein 13-like [Temnothorax curvispinosus]